MTTTTAAGRFIVTKEHRRFTEFADTVKREHTIGICYGPAGVGKTLSARRYAHWNKIGPYLDAWTSRDAVIHADLNRTRTLYYTPYSGTTPRRIRDDIHKSSRRIDACIDEHLTPATTTIIHTSGHDYTELLIIDEAERLTASSLEMLRDEYDRHTHGLIFIGMPGIEKRFSRYPQLYSRVGFAHHYRPLTNTELAFVLTRHWRTLGLDLDTDDFTDTQAIAAVARLTAGNFRLIGRLFAQVKRIMKINELTTVTADVIDTAASTLVIGTT